MGKPNEKDDDEFILGLMWPEEDRHLYTSVPLEWWETLVPIGECRRHGTLSAPAIAAAARIGHRGAVQASAVVRGGLCRSRSLQHDHQPNAKPTDLDVASTALSFGRAPPATAVAMPTPASRLAEFSELVRSPRAARRQSGLRSPSTVARLARRDVSSASCAAAPHLTPQTCRRDARRVLDVLIDRHIVEHRDGSVRLVPPTARGLATPRVFAHRVSVSW